MCSCAACIESFPHMGRPCCAATTDYAALDSNDVNSCKQGETSQEKLVLSTLQVEKASEATSKLDTSTFSK